MFVGGLPMYNGGPKDDDGAWQKNSQPLHGDLHAHATETVWVNRRADRRGTAMLLGALNALVRPKQTESLNSEVWSRSPDLKCRRLGSWWNLFSPATRKDPGFRGSLA
jgi:hypothetical protein